MESRSEPRSRFAAQTPLVSTTSGPSHGPGGAGSVAPLRGPPSKREEPGDRHRRASVFGHWALDVFGHGLPNSRAVRRIRQLGCRLVHPARLELLDPQPACQKKEWPLGTATQGKNWEDWVPTFSWHPRSSRPPFGYALLDQRAAPFCQIAATPSGGDAASSRSVAVPRSANRWDVLRGSAIRPHRGPLWSARCSVSFR